MNKMSEAPKDETRIIIFLKLDEDFEDRILAFTGFFSKGNWYLTSFKFREKFSENDKNIIGWLSMPEIMA